MVYTIEDSLLPDLKAAFEAERAAGEPAGYRGQSPDSFARLDAAVRSAILDAFKQGGAEAFSRYMHFNEDHYVRNLVYSCDDFELLVLCWGKGQGSRIHNHGDSHGWVTVLKGRVEEARFTNPGEALDKSPLASPTRPPALPGVLAAISPCPELRQIGKGVAGPGAQLHINDGIALHAVRCADDTDCEEGAVTLHLYAPPTKKVWLFEPGADRVVQRVPGYHSVGGVVSAQEA